MLVYISTIICNIIIDTLIVSISQVGFEWNTWVEAKVSSTAQSARDLTENETNEAFELIDGALT